MRYLYDALKRSARAHIWNGNDTGCRMWSTGGLKQSKPGWEVGDSAGDREICQMCRTSLTTVAPSASRLPMS